MHAYILTSFWLGVVGVSLRLLFLLGGTYPRSTQVTEGADVAKMLIGTGFLVWAGLLLWQ